MWRSRERLKFCSKKCEGIYRSGSRNHFWNGGRSVDKSGYILVKADHHPFANPNGYVREHRLVYEKFIGRFLRKDEIIHHINGVKDDNRIGNLKLLGSQSRHLEEERVNGKHIGRTKHRDFRCECGNIIFYAKNKCHKCYDRERNINL